MQHEIFDEKFNINEYLLRMMHLKDVTFKLFSLIENAWKPE